MTPSSSDPNNFFHDLDGQSEKKDALEEAKKKFLKSAYTKQGQETDLEQLRAGLNLVKLYLEADNYEEARFIYEHMQTMSNSPEHELFLAQAALSFIKSSGPENIFSARSIYDALPSAGLSPDCDLIIVEACTTLMDIFMEMGEMDEAESMLYGLDEIQNTSQITSAKAKTTLNLALDYIEKGNFIKGRAFINSLDLLGNSEEIRLFKARGLVELIAFYHQEDIIEAKKTFNDLEKFEDCLTIKNEKARGIINFMNFFIPDNMAKAHELFDKIQELGDAPEIKLAKAQGIINLINGYGAKDVEKAKEVFELMPKISKKVGVTGKKNSHESFSPDKKIEEWLLEMNLAKARAIYNLTSSYLDLGQRDKALELYELIQDLSNDNEVKLLKSRTSFNLLTDAIDKGKLKQAFDFYKQILSYGDTAELQLDQADACFYLMTAYLDSHDMKMAQKVFDALKELDTSLTIKLALSRASLLMILNLAENMKIDDAKNIFASMQEFGYEGKFETVLSMAYETIMKAYVRNGETENAHEFALATKRPGSQEDAKRLIINLNKSLYNG